MSGLNVSVKTALMKNWISLPTTGTGLRRRKGQGTEPMNTKTRIRKLEAQSQERAGTRSSEQCFPQNCICFPAGEAPDFEVFDTDEERSAAVALLCPLHGKRFTGRLPFQIYHAKWLRDREWKYDFQPHSRQYAKAMRASLPSDRWPATEVTQPDWTVR
jgi:hypothetical protein